MNERYEIHGESDITNKRFQTAFTGDNPTLLEDKANELNNADNIYDYYVVDTAQDLRDNFLDKSDNKTKR